MADMAATPLEIEVGKDHRTSSLESSSDDDPESAPVFVLANSDLHQRKDERNHQQIVGCFYMFLPMMFTPSVFNGWISQTSYEMPQVLLAASLDVCPYEAETIFPWGNRTPQKDADGGSIHFHSTRVANESFSILWDYVIICTYVCIYIYVYKWYMYYNMFVWKDLEKDNVQ